MLLQVAYQLTKEDFKYAQVQHRGWLGRFLQIVGIVQILSALPSLLAYQYFQGVIGLIVGSFLAFGTKVFASRSFKKEASLQLETKMVLSEEGLLITNSRGESRLNWNAFVRYTESKDLFMLYVQSQMFYIIPKRSFRTEDIVVLHQLFSRHIAAPSQSAGRPGIRAFALAFVIIIAIVMVYFATHANR